MFISQDREIKFSESLMKHQKIETRKGLTNVDERFMEHNVIVISNYFRDIKIESMADRLNMKRRMLETTLQNMKSKGKVDFLIDHRKGIISFKKGNFIYL